MADPRTAARRSARDHERHDEGLIAALLDRDPDVPRDVDRALAQRRIETCRECAAVQRDLLAVREALMQLPVPARTRSFQLTADDVTRLRSIPGEPRPAVGRLTREMHVPTQDHATHDALLIASLLDRTADDADRRRAEALVATCDACASLHGDLLALREATQALPVPARPRDFALSPADVTRLRPSGWRRLIAAFGSAGDIFSRPLAIGLTTIGLAGLLVTTIPGVLSGQATSGSAASTALAPVAAGAPNPESLEASGASKAAGPAPAAAATAAPAAAASAAPSFGAALVAPGAAPAPSGAQEPAAASPEPGASDETFDTFAGSDSSRGAALAPEPSPLAQHDSLEAGRDVSGSSGSPLDRSGATVLAGLLLAAGASLFALRWAARRLRSA